MKRTLWRVLADVWFCARCLIGAHTWVPFRNPQGDIVRYRCRDCWCMD